MKQILWFACVLLLLSITVLWLFFPSTLSWSAGIWEALGRPSLLVRLGYYIGFWVVIFLFAVRLGKSGPV